MNYKSTRLLVEAINSEMESVRKAAMGNMALGSLNELRDLVAQLAKKAERIALEDVPELAPADYVATMKPLVAVYHQALAARDLLAPCLCMDLRAAACILILVGDDKSVVKVARDPTHRVADLVVDTILASIDVGTKQVAAEVSEAREQAAVPTPEQVEAVRCLPGEAFRAGYEVEVGGLGVDESSGCPHDRLDHRKCGECGRTVCMECRRLVPEFDRMTDWHCGCVRPGAAPCQGAHDEPCGDDDCYVLALIRRNTGHDEEA